MNNIDLKKYTNMGLKGCGLMSIGCFGLIMILVIIGLFVGGDEETTSEKKSDEPSKAKIEFLNKKSEKKVEETLETDPYEELDNLIGLDEVKDQVRTLANFVEVQKQREANGLKQTKMTYHLVFTGNPGTGKTTVARIIARIYKDLGVIKKGHIVEVDRSGLIAEYQGQTATKTNKAIDEAIDGVLFVDEAYSLVPEGQADEYGQEAISTLLKRMEDDRDRLVVIVAGYKNEMRRFIDSNPGLQSRFNRYINFPDYSAEDLYNIFLMYAKKNQYTLSDDASSHLQKLFNTAVAHKDRHFGNARYVRNIFDKCIEHQANRLADTRNASKEQLTEITLEDIQAAEE